MNYQTETGIGSLYENLFKEDSGYKKIKKLLIDNTPEGKMFENS